MNSINQNEPNDEKTQPQKPLIEFDHVYLGYPSHVVLEDVSFKIFPKEYIGIIGPNGSGKTTLLRTLLDIIKPIKGKIIRNLSKEDGTPVKIGYVPQFSRITREFPLSVLEAVLMGRYGEIGLFRRPKKEDYEAAKRALHMVHMYHYAKRPIGHLSGGEQQKIMIARALSRNPQILLLDEPTSSLDFKMVKEVFDLIDELNKKYDLTIIMVHHNITLIRSHVKRLLILDKTLRYDGPPYGENVNEIIARAFKTEILLET